MAVDSKEQLVRYLERRAFRPVLTAKAQRYPESDRKTLTYLQKATEADVERFRHYASARAVLLNFKRDLTSRKAKQVQNKLKKLHLPTIGDVRDEFLELAAKLGVDSGRRTAGTSRGARSQPSSRAPGRGARSKKAH